jgi:hypothetical protein
VVPQQVLEPKTLQSVVNDKNSLLFLYQFYIDKISSLEGVKYTHSTIKLYTSSFTSLKRFLRQKDISVSDIDNVFARFLLLSHHCRKITKAIPHLKKSKLYTEF